MVGLAWLLIVCEDNITCMLSHGDHLSVLCYWRQYLKILEFKVNLLCLITSATKP